MRQTILITPATPAAAWVWPMLDLSDPSHSGSPSAGPGRRWPAGPGPRSGRPAWCPCRAPPPRRCRRRQAGVRQRLPDDPLLRRAVGRGQAVGRAVLVHRGAPHHRQHLVAVALGVGQPLQQRARRRPRPSRCRRPPPRTPCTAPSPRARRCWLNSVNVAGRGHHRHAAGQRQRALAARSDCTARCSATSEEEHAVSTVTAGPSSPRCRRSGRRRRCAALPVSR